MKALKLILIFILIMDQLAVCNMKSVGLIDELTENYQQLCSFSQLSQAS